MKPLDASERGALTQRMCMMVSEGPSGRDMSSMFWPGQLLEANIQPGCQGARHKALHSKNAQPEWRTCGSLRLQRYTGDLMTKEAPAET